MRTPGRWILVAGPPRAGTTFLGRILATGRDRDYIHEPFNPQSGLPGISGRFPYVPPSSDRLDQAVSDLMAYRVRLDTRMYDRDASGRRAIKALVGSRGPFYFRLARCNPFSRVAIVKDPDAALLAPLLGERFGWRSVAITRHPVAVVNSFKRLGWRPTEVARGFAENSDLVGEMDPRARHIVERYGHTDNPLLAACVVWSVTTDALLRAQEARPARTTLIRHEDLCDRPQAVVRDLSRFLDLEYTHAIDRRLRRETSGTRIHAGTRVQYFRRDSAALAQASPTAIDRDEVKTVLATCEPVASHCGY